jgi:hypothetical protein
VPQDNEEIRLGRKGGTSGDSSKKWIPILKIKRHIHKNYFHIATVLIAS